MITASKVALNVEANTPESAIKQVGQLMLDNQLIEPEYIDGMLNVFEEFGPYWVLTKGLAMPHARPEDGAINSGLVVMTLKEPVYFGHEDHDPVSIVVGMSATDQDQHVKNIQNLALVLGDDEKLKAIQQAQNTSEITTIMNNK